MSVIPSLSFLLSTCHSSPEGPPHSPNSPRRSGDCYLPPFLTHSSALQGQNATSTQCPAQEPKNNSSVELGGGQGQKLGSRGGCSSPTQEKQLCGDSRCLGTAAYKMYPPLQLYTRCGPQEPSAGAGNTPPICTGCQAGYTTRLQPRDLSLYW